MSMQCICTIQRSASARVDEREVDEPRTRPRAARSGTAASGSTTASPSAPASGRSCRPASPSRQRFIVNGRSRRCGRIAGRDRLVVVEEVALRDPVVREEDAVARSRAVTRGHCERRAALLAQHLAGDHEPLDLVRALVDLGDLRVAHHPLDRVLLHVPVPAEHLDGVGRHRHRGVGAEELRDRRELRQLGPVDARVDQLRRSGRGARARPRTASPCRRASPRRAGGSRSARPSSRACARTRARSRWRPRRSRAPGRRCPGRERSRIRIASRNPSPSSPSRFAAGTRQPLKKHLAGRRALDPHLRLDPADLEPRRVRLDDERGDPARGRRPGRSSRRRRRAARRPRS